MEQKKEFPVIEVPANGKRNWGGGAWCLVWVYSTDGNFILKGFLKECEDYIKDKGWKCWARFNLYHTKSMLWGRNDNKKYRTFIQTFNCSFGIYSPSYEKRKGKSLRNECRFTVYSKEENKKHLKIKRLPTVFTNFNFSEAPVLNKHGINLTNLGNNPAFEGIRRKFNWE